GFLGNSFSQEPAGNSGAMQGLPANSAGSERAIESQSSDTLQNPHRHFAEAQSLLSVFQELTLWSWVFMVWLLVVLAHIVRCLRQRLRLRRLLHEGEKESNVIVLRQLSTLAARLTMRRAPTLLVTARNCSPFVCGFWRPLLILPRPLLTALGPEQLEQVLL